MQRSRFFALVCLGLVVLSLVLSRPRMHFVYANDVEENNITTAKAMCCMEVNSGRILFEKNLDEQLPEASLTKIITAIVVIENTPNLDEIIEVPKEAAGVEGSSIYLKAGEKISVRDLLYGLMLRSGNDSAVALAIATSGSVSEFINLANTFCARVGATNTHLVTPHGLHDDAHYSTARDLATISCYAMKNETFREIVGTKITKISNESGASERVIKNKNRLLSEMSEATGIKTGYTKKAGRCFVGSAKRDDVEVVCILLNCGPMFEESETLLKRALDEFKMVSLVEPYETHEVSVTNSESKCAHIYSPKGFKYPLRNEELSSIYIERDIPESIVAPLKANQKIGQLRISLDKNLIFCDNFYAVTSVDSNDYFSNVKKIIEEMA